MRASGNVMVAANAANAASTQGERRSIITVQVLGPVDDAEWCEDPADCPAGE